MSIRPQAHPAAALAPWLQLWLAAGLLGALSPFQAWPSHYVGPSAWWGVAAPAICLALLQRERLSLALLALRSRASRRGRGRGAVRRSRPA